MVKCKSIDNTISTKIMSLKNWNYLNSSSLSEVLLATFYLKHRNIKPKTGYGFDSSFHRGYRQIQKCGPNSTFHKNRADPKN